MKHLLYLAVSGLCLNTIFLPASGGRLHSYPALLSSRPGSSSFLDRWLLLAGSRRAAADYAWIRLLQYYGTHFTDEDSGEEMPRRGPDDEEKEGEGEHHEHVHMFAGRYPQLAAYAGTVTALDPFFGYAYLYSAGALAFNQNRVDEAVRLLKYGTAYLPDYWKIQMLLSAIAYNVRTDTAAVIKTLEPGVEDPDCPTLIVSFLALLYEKEGRFRDAARLWEKILAESAEEGYRDRALKHLAYLEKKHRI